MSQQSSVSDALYLLDGLEDFKEHARKLAENTRRNLAILSTDLDHPIYEQEDFLTAISTLVRTSRYAQVQILVKNTKSLIERGHQLARLSQRLPSKVVLRKLVIEPENSDMAFMLCDNSQLLYKNDDQVYKGFANYDAAVEVKRLREIFNYVWQYSEPEPDLQLLHI